MKPLTGRIEKQRHCYFPTGWRFISESEKPWSSASYCNSPLDLPQDSPKLSSSLKDIDLDIGDVVRFSMPDKVRLGAHASRVDLKTLMEKVEEKASFPHTQSVLRLKRAKRSVLKPPDSPKPARNALRREYQTAWYMPKDKWRVEKAQKVRTHDMKLNFAQNVYRRLHEALPGEKRDEKLDENRRKLSRMLGYRMYMDYLERERLRIPPGLRDVPQFEI